MVLNKRKPVGLLPNPTDAADNVDVFVMRGTNEVFTSYEQYLKRFDWLSQRKFTDAVNGKTGLTYWEALDSETKSSATIENSFPEVLRHPILRQVQFSTISRMDELVNTVFDEFKHDFFPGEEVLCIFDAGEQSKGVIREKAKFPMIRGPDGVIQREPFARYFVRLKDSDDEALLDDKHVRRDRNVFTKQNLRAFLKNSLQRENWIGAPWLVKEPLAIHYRLPMEIPAHLLQDARLIANKQHMLQVRPAKVKKTKSELAKASREDFLGIPQDPFLVPYLDRFHEALDRDTREQERWIHHPPPPPTKYPIEDLEVPMKRNGVSRPTLKFWTDEMAESIRKPALRFSGLTMKSMGALLEIWNTLNVQAEVYVLDSFTFDDFVDAMSYTLIDPPCTLLEEIHCAVLKLYVDESGKVLVKDVPDIEDASEDEEEEEEESEIQTPVLDVPARSTRSRRSLVDAPVEIAHVLVEDSKRGNRALEMLGEQTWIERLVARDFEDGGWQVILIGLLHQLSTTPHHKEFCEAVLAELAPETEDATRETAVGQYAKLDANLRIETLQLLTLLTIRTDAIKNFLDTCAEDMTDVRKRKIEHQRERKSAVDQLHAKEKERKLQQPSNMPDPSSPKNEASELEASEIKEDTIEINGSGIFDSDDEARARGLRRGADRKRKRDEEAARREKERAEKAEAAKLVAKQTKEFRKLLSEIDGLKKKIVELEAKIEDCDDDLREANVQRTKVLGKDRFCNRYYWFERNGQPFAGLPRSSTASYGYANSRIWVQGPDELEREGFIDRTKEEQQEYMKMHGCSVPQRREQEEGRTTLRNANQWAYIDDADGLDALIGWLDERGEREKKLRKELLEWREKIVTYMTARHDFFAAEQARQLEADEEMAARRATVPTTRHKIQEEHVASLPRCTKWTNSMAIDDLGHLHSRPAKPRTKRQRKSDHTGNSTTAPAKGVAVVLGKNGKPLTRQGTK